MRARLQRGITDMWLVGIIVVVIAMAALSWAVVGYLKNLEKNAYDRGKLAAEQAYAVRDQAVLQQRVAQVARLQESARAKEAADAATMAKLTYHLNQEKAKNATLATADDNRVRDGFRLRDPGANTASAAECNRSPSGEAATAIARSDAATGGELSGEASAFLFSEANRADAIVAQLTTAQSVITEQMRTCNGP